MKQLEVNPEVTKALAPIITNSTDVWKNLPDQGFSLDDVKNLPLPDEDKEKSLQLMCNMDGGKHLEKAIDILGSQRSTNCIAYPPNSHMYWHTNSDREGIRTYYTFTVKAGCFIYIHPETGEMIVDEDQVGWTVRQFEIRKDKPLWHCVWADGVRFSFGFTQPFEEAT